MTSAPPGGDAPDGEPRSGEPRSGEEASGRPRPLKAPPRQPKPQRRVTDQAQQPGVAWNSVGTLGSGLAVWGLIGWGVDRLTGLHDVFLPIGIVVGIALAIYLVIHQALHR